MLLEGLVLDTDQKGNRRLRIGDVELLERKSYWTRQVENRLGPSLKLIYDGSVQPILDGIVELGDTRRVSGSELIQYFGGVIPKQAGREQASRRLVVREERSAAGF